MILFLKFQEMLKTPMEVSKEKYAFKGFIVPHNLQKKLYTSLNPKGRSI